MPASGTPLLQVRDLVQEFVVRDYGGVRGGVVHAVSGVSFNVWPGETLGIVGETGSGKSTLARSVLQAPRPKAGTVTFRGADLTTLRGKRLLQARRHLQMVFQDPFSSLDPKWKVRDLVAEPLIAYRVGRPGRQAAPGRGGARARRARPGGARRPAAQGAVRWPGPAGRHRQGARDRARADHLRRAGVIPGRPHPGPGPQPVRAAAGRTRPVLPVHRPRPRPGQAGQRPGGGDVPGQAVRGRAGRGGLPAAAAPVHEGPARLGARSRERPKAATTIRGEPPSPVHPPSGCRFRTRCPRAEQRCADEEPVMRELPTGPTAGHSVACHFPLVPAADSPARSEEKIGETPR